MAVYGSVDFEETCRTDCSKLYLNLIMTATKAGMMPLHRELKVYDKNIVEMWEDQMVNLKIMRSVTDISSSTVKPELKLEVKPGASKSVFNLSVESVNIILSAWIVRR